MRPARRVRTARPTRAPTPERCPADQRLRRDDVDDDGDLAAIPRMSASKCSAQVVEPHLIDDPARDQAGQLTEVPSCLAGAHVPGKKQEQTGGAISKMFWGGAFVAVARRAGVVCVELLARLDRMELNICRVARDTRGVGPHPRPGGRAGRRDCSTMSCRCTASGARRIRLAYARTHRRRGCGPHALDAGRCRARAAVPTGRVSAPWRTTCSTRWRIIPRGSRSAPSPSTTSRVERLHAAPRCWRR